MLENVRKYFLTCPLLSDDGHLGIEYLDDKPTNYSIEKTPSFNPIVNENIDGSSTRHFLFSLTSREIFGQSEIEQNLANDKFYENLAEWLENNTKKGVLPTLEDGKISTSILAISSGYLFSVDQGMKVARYKIQCELIYEMEE